MFFVRWLRVCAIVFRFAARYAFDGGTGRRLLLGEGLAECLIALGPLYVKAGQILATRSDLLPDTMTTPLARLQDDVPPMAGAELERVLQEAYGGPVEEVFESFDREVVASASIAQVHRATLKGGRRVAVKVVRRGVKRRLAGSFRALGPFAWALDRWIPACRRVRLLRRFGELRGLLVPQCDMTREAANQEAIRENFENHPYVHIPRVHREYCREGILVMDFVDGLPGRDARKAKIPAAQLARRAQEAIYTMLYFHGLCHADPHPGNLFVSEDGRISFIDFGIVARLSEEEKWGLSSFFFACTRHEWDLAVERSTRIFVEGDVDRLLALSTYREEMKAVLRYHFKERTCRWSTIAWFREANAVLLRHGGVYSTSFTKIELVFFSGEGFITQVDPDIDIWENARKFNDRYSPYLSDALKGSFDDWFRATSKVSLALQAEAAPVLIAQTHLDRCVLPSNYPLFVERASGCHLFCVDGHRYIDLSCGYGPHILGYAHPVVVEAVAEAVAQGCVNALGHRSEVDLARILVGAFPSGETAIFSNSGTEAVIHAVRLCRAWRRRDTVAKFEGHYHGFSDQGLVSSWFRCAGDKDEPRPVGGSVGCHSGVVESSLVLQYGHSRSLERLREQADRVACVILEPAPTSMAEWDATFLRQLRDLCTETGIPLIFDEVVTGFRVAWGGVQTLAGVEPDLTCLGKIIGGSLPCGAVVGRRDIMDGARTTRDPFRDVESKAFVSGTMSGNSLVCAAGVAVLTHLKEHPEIYVRLEEQTRWLRETMVASAARRGVAFRMKGARSIFALSFDHRSPKLYREKVAGSNFKANLALSYYMRRQGVYVPELHTMMLNAMHTQGDLEVVAAAFDHCLGEMVADGFFVL